jgi:hypothetical protein
MSELLAYERAGKQNVQLPVGARGWLSSRQLCVRVVASAYQLWLGSLASFLREWPRSYDLPSNVCL